MPVASSKAEEHNTTAADLLSALEKDDLDLGDLSSTGSDLLSSIGSYFNESFIDFSDYLTKGTSDDFEMAEAVAVETDSKEVKGKKRNASEAFPIKTEAVLNPDHCDYISKKRRLSSTSSMDSTSTVDTGMPEMSRLEKYRERRRKNNIASKRSRETRKDKFNSMEQKAIELEKHNAELQQKVKELESLTKRMRETLIQKMTMK